MVFRSESGPACYTHEPAPYHIRTGAEGLLTGVEYSRVRDSAWNVHYPHITTRLGIELVDIQKKLLDRVRVRLCASIRLGFSCNPVPQTK